MNNRPEKLVRPSVEAMDVTLGAAHPVLNHGFVRVIDYMGNEAAVVQAARVSYGEGTKEVSEDRGLLRYLLRHRHTSPFEMCEIKLHVKLPVFVARQWIRHRTANVNEYSARYSILRDEFHFPAGGELAPQSANNKQGRAGGYDSDAAEAILQKMDSVYRHAAETYFDLIEGDNLARETAREVLPVAAYTEWYWKVDLHNLLHFLKLRMDPHAQAEIRAYAEVVGGIVEAWLPNIWEAFEDYALHAVTLSRMEIEALRSYFQHCRPDREHDGWPEPKGLSERESREFFSRLGLLDV